MSRPCHRRKPGRSQRRFCKPLPRIPMLLSALMYFMDARIQFVAEREVKKMVQTHHAKWGSAVAMDPHTGDILALANFPTFDPNSLPKQEELHARENLAVAAPFEPGSVFKVITLSAALETTKLRDLLKELLAVRKALDVARAAP